MRQVRRRGAAVVVMLDRRWPGLLRHRRVQAGPQSGDQRSVWQIRAVSAALTTVAEASYLVADFLGHPRKEPVLSTPPDAIDPLDDDIEQADDGDDMSVSALPARKQEDDEDEDDDDDDGDDEETELKKPSAKAAASKVAKVKPSSKGGKLRPAEKAKPPAKVKGKKLVRGANFTRDAQGELVRVPRPVARAVKPVKGKRRFLRRETLDNQETFRTTDTEHENYIKELEDTNAAALAAGKYPPYRSMSYFFRAKLGLPT